MTRLGFLALSGLLLVASPALAGERAGVCVLRATGTRTPQGEVWFSDTAQGLRIAVALRGLKPRAEHALHMHVFGDLGRPAQDGFGQPLSRRGIPHAGDLGLLKIGPDGTVRGVRDVRGLKLDDVLGRGVTLRSAAGKVAGLGVIALGNDQVPPTVEVVGQESRSDHALFVCRVADDRALATFGVKGGAPTPDVFSKQPQREFRVKLPTKAGKNRAVLVATDGAGNAREVPVEWEHDGTAPVIKVLAPRPGSQLNGNPVNVVVSVEDPNLASVTIGGQPAQRDAKGRWRRTVQAKDGANHVAVKAADSFGNSSQADVAFTFDGTPPGIEAEVVIVVEGKVDDLSAKLTINGEPVRFDPRTGAYSAKVKADPRDPSRVTIVAIDEYGNRTTEVRKLR